MMWALMGTAMHHQLSMLESDWKVEEKLILDMVKARIAETK